MSHSLHKITAGDNVPDRINAVVETPAGCKVRYAYNTQLSVFELALPVGDGDVYPADYGFVPSTMAQDGFPLDIFVLCQSPTFPGCVVECRPIGVLHLSDGRIRDSKILAIPVVEKRFAEARDLHDIPEEIRNVIHDLFDRHRDLSGRRQEIVGWAGAQEAKDIVLKAWQGFLL